jgi:hypothetical protein
MIALHTRAMLGSRNPHIFSVLCLASLACGTSTAQLAGDGGSDGTIASGDAAATPVDATSPDGGGCPGCTPDAGAGDSGATCPTNVQDNRHACAQQGQKCTLTCSGCGVDPFGRGLFTLDPISCECDPVATDGGLVWNCEAIDCLSSICDLYLDPACSVREPCDSGVPEQPLPCGSLGACAIGNYCQKTTTGGNATFSCEPLPNACTSTQTCSCLTSNGVTCSCAETGPQLFITCP